MSKTDTGDVVNKVLDDSAHGVLLFLLLSNLHDGKQTPTQVGEALKELIIATESEIAAEQKRSGAV